ncbi:hypothetical protein LTR37_010120 [Vermiconidia calcicola]|uniref:Uncharacterized protein n=1 Tax=Vermiconidia calcicola TaxID=1690605 RepID=A0ACC3N8L0_9PEZI|nr:hypothetical protein LTR37_010120 [Vermiconidia calcicola]
MTQYGPVGDFPVSGRIVAVTGGGSGIGFAFVKACHSKAEQYVSKASESEIVFQKCDVTSWDDLHGVISVSVAKFGAVPDVYAPVAGIYEPAFSNFWDDETSGSYKTMRINVDHPIKFTRLAMRALAGAEKQGVVVLVASTAGIRANYLACLYTASKHAMVGFAKAMGQADIDEGVRVNAILPGLVSSPLWHDRDDNMMEWGKFDDRKQLQPSDIGDLMLRMVESKAYEGGTCVLKTPYEEKIQEEGHQKMVEKLKEYDPSPRPEAGLDRVKGVLQKERGKKWT